MQNKYLPEGELILSEKNSAAFSSLSQLKFAMESKEILEGYVSLCDSDLNLHVDLGAFHGIIPKNEVAYSQDGSNPKDICAITRVGKAVCFCIESIEEKDGEITAILSRKNAQKRCCEEYINTLECGDIIGGKVTHIEHFGAFVDIGCGIVSLLNIDSISVSRISSPRDRFCEGMKIRVIVRDIDKELHRIYLSHKELLGTWEENAAAFSPGQTVAGIVRSIEDYGIFIELAPNLAGLSEYREGVYVGQYASVYIKSIIPERMKIKLVLVDSFDSDIKPQKLKYFIPPEIKHIDHFRFSPDVCQKTVESIFKSDT
ncbi:MAG: 30S ribosomal protein S1 [Clostridia bacterium]|nr:30S ribosomal protein S1 [Clostridia bacterium]